MYILRVDKKELNKKKYFTCAMESYDRINFNWHDGKKRAEYLNDILPLRFVTDVKFEPVDFVESGGACFLGSTKMNRCFELAENQNEIEIFPAQIYNKKLDTTYKYWVYNILNVKKIIDIKHSLLSKYSDPDLRPDFLKIKLTHKIINDKSEIYSDPNLLAEFIISEHLMKEIKAANLTGVEILPINLYYNIYYKD